MDETENPRISFFIDRVEGLYNDNFRKQSMFLEMHIDPSQDKFLRKFAAVVSSLDDSKGLEILEINPKYKHLQGEGDFCFHIHKIDSIRAIVNFLRAEDAQIFIHASETKTYTKQEFFDTCQKQFLLCQKTRQ